MSIFQHRDLHWGQILVKGSNHVRKKVPRNPGRSTTSNADADNIPMDHPSHGVTATIIDLGLARMEARDGSSSIVHWTQFDELIFEGEGKGQLLTTIETSVRRQSAGEYQFDVYRMMRHVFDNGIWDQYRPLTNVMVWSVTWWTDSWLTCTFSSGCIISL
jgi:serine/threonine-protein kinase haspin